MTSGSTMISAAAVSAPKPRTRCVWSAAERAEWLALFERSGKPLSEFCRENDLPEATLSLWRRQLREGGEPAGEDGSFVEVPVAQFNAAVGRSEAVAAVTVRVPGGLTLEVAAGTDALWLASVLRALQPDAA